MKPMQKSPFHLHRRGLTWGVSGFLAVGLGTLAVLPVATGRTSPRPEQVEIARDAVDRARQANAGRWAPDALRTAEKTLKQALIEHRHQELRFLLLRDFRASEKLLLEAQEAGRLAARTASKRRRDLVRSTRDALDQATLSLQKTESFAKAMHLAKDDRSLLQRSRLDLAEAKLLEERGEYAGSLSQARAAKHKSDLVRDRAVRLASRYTDTELVQSWRSWIDETVKWSRRHGKPAIIVFKEKHLLTLYDRGKPVRNYVAELGFNSVGDKSRSGDAATPEGRYKITTKKDVGYSTYHMALLLDYPNADDRRRFDRARKSGLVPRGAHPGSLIEIHGDGGRGKDWTKGCVALANADIEDLFERVEVGTPVTIVGGDGQGGTFTNLMDAHDSGADSGLD